MTVNHVDGYLSLGHPICFWLTSCIRLCKEASPFGDRSDDTVPKSIQYNYSVESQSDRLCLRQKHTDNKN